MNTKTEARRLMQFRIRQAQRTANGDVHPDTPVMEEARFPTLTHRDRLVVGCTALGYALLWVLTHTNPISLPYYLGKAIARCTHR